MTLCSAVNECYISFVSYSTFPFCQNIVFHDYSELEYTTSGRCVFSATVKEVSPPARNVIVSLLIGNRVSSSPLFLSPGSSLHHPVQRRQRRGGVHVGVPLPGGEASPAGPLTACQPGAASPQYYPCEVQWRPGNRLSRDAQRSSRASPSPSGPNFPGRLKVNGTWLKLMWSNTFPATCALLSTAL